MKTSKQSSSDSLTSTLPSSRAEPRTPLYDLVVHAVERPLIEYAMSMCHRNQCAAAQLLGINRNTLRKKLLEHGMLQARGRSKQKEK